MTSTLGRTAHVQLKEPIVDSIKRVEHGCRMGVASLPSFLGLGLEDGHVPTFWLTTVMSQSLGTMRKAAAIHCRFSPSYNVEYTSPKMDLL